MYIMYSKPFKFRIIQSIQPFLYFYGIIVFKNKFLLMSFINVAYSLNNFSKMKNIQYDLIKKMFCILFN